MTRDERTRFPPLCPDFVAELHSPWDRLSVLSAKMEEYIDNGARLGWLLDPIEKRATVYRPGKPAVHLDDPQSIDGEDVLEGFTLDLREIFQAQS